MRAKKTESPQTEELRRNLLVLVSGLRRPLKEPEKFVETVCDHVSAREESLRGYGSSDRPAVMMAKIDNYLDCLKALRKAWLALPRSAREITLDYIVDSDSTLLPKQVTSEFPGLFFTEKTDLPEWRREGMAHVAGWGYDLEMIDVLYESALWYRNTFAVNQKRVDNSHLGLIYNIANFSEHYGITLSAKPRSVFYRMVLIIFPEMMDPGGIIKLALKYRAEGLLRI